MGPLLRGRVWVPAGSKARGRRMARPCASRPSPEAIQTQIPRPFAVGADGGDPAVHDVQVLYLAVLDLENAAGVKRRHKRFSLFAKFLLTVCDHGLCVLRATLRGRTFEQPPNEFPFRHTQDYDKVQGLAAVAAKPIQLVGLCRRPRIPIEEPAIASIVLGQAIPNHVVGDPVRHVVASIDVPLNFSP